MKKFIADLFRKFVFSVSEIEHKNNYGQRKYRLYKILGIKIKLNLLYWNLSSNKIYILDKNGNKQLVSSKKDLRRYGEIQIEGENNELVLFDDPSLLHFKALIIGNNNYVEIKSVKDESRITASIVANSARLQIGHTLFIVDAYFRIDTDGVKILVEDDCMFATSVNIWAGDAHKIYDLTTKKYINPGKDVTIGNHVWIGRYASVNKGAVIPDGCVVGANSFVNKVFDEKNCIIAGTPAKIVKRNIRWEL